MNIELFPKEITFRSGMTVSFDLEGDLRIDRSNLDEEFMRQASAFVRYGTAYEIAQMELGRIKVELDQLCAQLDVLVRKNATTNNIKLTEKMADHAVKGSVEYLEKNDELLQAQKIAGLLKQARDAMIHKKDALKELAYNQRQELSADITMKSDYVRGYS